MDFGALFVQLFYNLCQLAVFAIFVTAILQVIKGISAHGVLKIITEILHALVKSTDKKGKLVLVSDEAWKTLNFIVALVYLKAFQFGVMARLLNIDISRFGAFAWWLDYIGSASMVYMGADWFFKQFGVLFKTAKEADVLNRLPADLSQKIPVAGAVDLSKGAPTS